MPSGVVWWCLRSVVSSSSRLFRISGWYAQGEVSHQLMCSAKVARRDIDNLRRSPSNGAWTASHAAHAHAGCADPSFELCYARKPVAKSCLAVCLPQAYSKVALSLAKHRSREFRDMRPSDWRSRARRPLTTTTNSDKTPHRPHIPSQWPPCTRT
jgi:hypothetical protein